MSGKDKPHREAKKPKKDTKKESISTVVATPVPEVEVIKKGKKPKEEEF
jgi:hypothetical protein